MSEPLLNVMKIMLLAGLYLFFVRVLWSVMNELRDPRRGVARQADSQSAKPARRTRGPAPVAPAPVAPTPAMAVPAGTMRTAPPVPVRPPVVPEPAYASASPAAPGLAGSGRLTVVAPPERVGIVYTLGTEITIGRAPTNGVPLDDTYVSTVHARIFATNAAYFVEDLSSRNGTLLGGHPLMATTALSPGDRLTIGATTLEFS